MMIPPVVRIGYPTEPEPLHEYVCLVDGRGWMMLQWRPDLGFFNEDVIYPGSNGLVEFTHVRPEHIRCWMPQNGT